jgi:hypothetical protein
MLETKVWYLSKTIWGVIISFLALIAKTFFNVYIPDFSAEIVEILGLVIALYGRIKAEVKIS